MTTEPYTYTDHAGFELRAREISGGLDIAVTDHAGKSAMAVRPSDIPSFINGLLKAGGRDTMMLDRAGPRGGWGQRVAMVGDWAVRITGPNRLTIEVPNDRDEPPWLAPAGARLMASLLVEAADLAEKEPDPLELSDMVMVIDEVTNAIGDSAYGDRIARALLAAGYRKAAP